MRIDKNDVPPADSVKVLCAYSNAAPKISTLTTVYDLRVGTGNRSEKKNGILIAF